MFFQFKQGQIDFSAYGGPWPGENGLVDSDQLLFALAATFPSKYFREVLFILSFGVVQALF